MTLKAPTPVPALRAAPPSSAVVTSGMLDLLYLSEVPEGGLAARALRR
jgi:hypothetical protein